MHPETAAEKGQVGVHPSTMKTDRLTDRQNDSAPKLPLPFYVKARQRGKWVEEAETNLETVNNLTYPMSLSPELKRMVKVCVSVCVCVGGGGGRERQTDRQTDTDRDRQTERQTDRQTDSDRDGQTD